MTTKYTLHRETTYHSVESGDALVMIIVGVVISSDCFVFLKERKKKIKHLHKIQTRSGVCIFFQNSRSS